MAYITQADVEAAAGGASRLLGIADADRDGSNDTTLIDAAIAAADAWVDAELGKRFEVPLATPSDWPLVISIAAEEAVYILKRRAGLATEDDRDDHEERLQLLKDIASGETTAGDDDGPDAGSLVGDRYSTRSTDLAVSRENLKGFA